jgi:hypothetical protein
LRRINGAKNGYYIANILDKKILLLRSWVGGRKVKAEGIGNW